MQNIWLFRNARKAHIIVELGRDRKMIPLFL